MIRLLKKKILVGETEGRPGARVLAASHHQGSKGLLLAPGTLGAGPNLPGSWEESPDTGHQTPMTRSSGAHECSAQGAYGAVRDRPPHLSLQLPHLSLFAPQPLPFFMWSPHMLLPPLTFSLGRQCISHSAGEYVTERGLKTIIFCCCTCISEAQAQEKW